MLNTFAIKFCLASKMKIIKLTVIQMIKFTLDLDILHIGKHRAKKREVLQLADIMQTLMHSNMHFL